MLYFECAINVLSYKLKSFEVTVPRRAKSTIHTILGKEESKLLPHTGKKVKVMKRKRVTISYPLL